jgi:Ni2+-binding GTPase involved in maturation of urease and hydrogenase
MTDPVRFLMIGGFLGAGKTTTIAALAKAYLAAGRRVGVVTNDQGADLVDTRTFRQQGVPVSEIAGACFCCRFDDLTDAVAGLTAAQRPDVILGEPVGSCTDLVATVIHPLRRFYADRVVTAPLAVLTDPHRALKILGKDPRGGFSPKAAYIYEKQLEEADVIAINKLDAITPEQRGDVGRLLAGRCPGKPIVALSARTGEGLSDLIAAVDADSASDKRAMEIDYDVYAAGEAELGWLNLSAQVSAERAIDVDGLLRELIESIAAALRAAALEPAHLKIIGIADGRHGIANLVRGDGRAELSIPANYADAREVELTLNARVFTAPETLRTLVSGRLERVCADRGLTLRTAGVTSLSPGRPVPTHRLATAR